MIKPAQALPLRCLKKNPEIMHVTKRRRGGKPGEATAASMIISTVLNAIVGENMVTLHMVQLLNYATVDTIYIMYTVY